MQLCSLLVLYGLEVIVPTGKALTVLERLLKQVLSLPTTVADPAIYPEWSFACGSRYTAIMDPGNSGDIELPLCKDAVYG